MLAVKGTYKNGKVFIKEKIQTEEPVDVIVTFLDKTQLPDRKQLDINKFSFKKAKKLLSGYKGSLSNAIIEERRSAI
ncbi:MAG: hypothetical protein EPN22_07825 [Nitrospirae bacterium]|nr:MAG: hypothetical protein EPN22_07825 [Nitrospirota bacterium]